MSNKSEQNIVPNLLKVVFLFFHILFEGIQFAVNIARTAQLYVPKPIYPLVEVHVFDYRAVEKTFKEEGYSEKKPI